VNEVSGVAELDRIWVGASKGIGKWGGLLIVSGDGDNGKVLETTLVECLPVILFDINGF
jgi:hypothetical protein